MAVEVTFRGDGGELVLAVEGYELPEITTGSDANRLKLTCQLSLQELGTGRTEGGGWVLDCAVGVDTGAPGRTEFQIPTDLDRARVTRDELEAIVQTYPTRGDPAE